MRLNEKQKRALESDRATTALKEMGVSFKRAGEAFAAANPTLPYYEVPKVGIIPWIWRLLGRWLDKVGMGRSGVRDYLERPGRGGVVHLDFNKGHKGYYITLTGRRPATYFFPDLYDALAELQILVWSSELKTVKVEFCIHKAAADDIQTLLGEAGMAEWLAGLVEVSSLNTASTIRHRITVSLT